MAEAYGLHVELFLSLEGKIEKQRLLY